MPLCQDACQQFSISLQKRSSFRMCCTVPACPASANSEIIWVQCRLNHVHLFVRALEKNNLRIAIGSSTTSCHGHALPRVMREAGGPACPCLSSQWLMAFFFDRNCLRHVYLDVQYEKPTKIAQVYLICYLAFLMAMPSSITMRICGLIWQALFL